MWDLKAAIKGKPISPLAIIVQLRFCQLLQLLNAICFQNINGWLHYHISYLELKSCNKGKNKKKDLEDYDKDDVDIKRVQSWVFSRYFLCVEIVRSCHGFMSCQPGESNNDMKNIHVILQIFGSSHIFIFHPNLVKKVSQKRISMLILLIPITGHFIL